MKRLIIFLVACLLPAGLLHAKEVVQGQFQEQVEEFKPLFSNVDNSPSAQKAMLSNIYSLKIRREQHQKKSTKGKRRTGASKGSSVSNKETIISNEASDDRGQAAAFRLTKNWFLTCSHGPFQTENPKNRSFLRATITVEERPDAPGAAPFYLVVDLTRNDIHAKGRVFLFNPRLKLDASNTGRGEDLALIYVPDENLKQKKSNQGVFNDADKHLAAAAKYLSPEHLAAAKKGIVTAKKSNDVWDKFFNYPIPSFHLFILSEKTVIQELGYPDKTKSSYSFPLTAYYIQDPNELTTFSFVPIGTHAGTNAIFYRRVSDLKSGTSGSPMTYGNYVVSVDSAVNCSPMLTPKFYLWLKRTMGGDYPAGMCVEPAQQGGGSGQHRALKAPTDPRWNDARP